MTNLQTIEKVVYDLCVEANTKLPEDIFAKILKAYETEMNPDAKAALGLILKNAKMAYEKKMPLCQDTGQVLVFVKGQTFPIGLKDAINAGVKKAYEENFFRKSVVKNAIFDRTNTQTNTPCIIYTEVEELEGLEFEVLLKGGGSENVCKTKMLSPTASEDEITDFVVETVKEAGAKACPPYFIGIGIGGTLEYAALLSKKALIKEKNADIQHQQLADKIQNAVNDLNIGPAGFGGRATALDVKILTDFTHIACLPVAITINCHSSRHAKGVIKPNNEYKIKTSNKMLEGFDLDSVKSLAQKDFIRVEATDVKTLKSLKKGQNVLLSGEIYTARDAAHKRILEMIKKGEKLPFEIKNSIIFYAGPCPCPEGCTVGSIGPTTSVRMDKFTPILYEKGMIATIGKGERSEEVKTSIEHNKGLYFTVIGGIACYLSEKFIKRELIAFEDLGTEAIWKFSVRDLPLRVELS